MSQEQQQQQVPPPASSPPRPQSDQTSCNGRPPAVTGDQTTNGLTTTTTAPASSDNQASTGTRTKLNGLKNRIIQRPPPLILDKVSNFYDADLDSNAREPTKAADKQTSIGQQQQQQQHDQQQQQQQQQTQPTTSITTAAAQQNNPAQSANHKFWASLNQNASSRQKLPATSRPTKEHSESSTTDQSLGADLIITHRNSTGSLGNGGHPSSRHPRISTSTSLLLQQKQQQQQQQLSNNNEQVLGPVLSHVDHQLNDNTSTNAGGSTRLHDLSNNSEMDDSSTHGGVASETDGGNLIGVDNSSPPPPPMPIMLNQAPQQVPPTTTTTTAAGGGGGYAPSNGGAQSHLSSSSTAAVPPGRRPALVVSDEPPPSASSIISSRPRSNNPFLATDEELMSSHVETTNQQQTKRPMSFLAATTADGRQYHCQFNEAADGFAAVQEQFNNLHLHPAQLENPYCTNDGGLINQHQHHQQQQQQQQQQQLQAAQDQRDGSSYKSSLLLAQQQLQQQQQSIYGVYFDRQQQQQNNCSSGQHHQQSYANYEPTISLDSESAVCKPPPSATMQLPHWTDAIYELNNAILESSSVGGGAENGQFIYIIDNGDIILELDHVKVSGFTLVEFTELLESKPVHLLNAVQTKHSHGLTTDLKHYLNCSFPKNSNDKELQDLIRENIYRRTIPCTTRPQKEGELDKVDYHFLTKEHFVEMNNRGMLLECGMFGGHYYGTMKPLSDLNSLSIYGSMDVYKEVTDEMRQPLQASHPAISMPPRITRDQSSVSSIQSQTHGGGGGQPLYENHESLKMHHHHQQMHDYGGGGANVKTPSIDLATIQEDHYGQLMSQQQGKQQPNILAVDNEALPMGWERVIDQTHGTYYIDHNTQRTQYERPYEIELTKGTMGFGFTLVEADNGVLLVRSVIPGGPASMNGMIRPGDILISAVGVPVANLQHTDIARLFSTFAVGDRVRLTFARSAYVVDSNLVPDEYLFSNGTNGDLAVALGPNYFNQNMVLQEQPQPLNNPEYEFLNVYLKRGESGFGFTIVDPGDGSQRVKEIQSTETSSKLKQGDILISLNGQDITKLTHKEVVERLKNCRTGQDVALTVKRKKRFRSKTPMATRSKTTGEYSLDSTPQRKCKTPSLDGLMLNRSSNIRASFLSADERSQPNNIISNSTQQQLPPAPLDFIGTPPQQQQQQQLVDNYGILHQQSNLHPPESIYSVNPVIINDPNELYYQQYITTSQQPAGMSSLPVTSAYQQQSNGFKPFGSLASDGLIMDNMTNSVHLSEASMPPMQFANVTGLNQMNQYNNFMNNDKLVMMQMQLQQQRYQQPPTATTMQQQQQQSQTSDYHQMPLYSNSDMLKQETTTTHNPMLPVPMKPASVINHHTHNQYTTGHHQLEPIYTGANGNFLNNYYANNEEIALQRVQYGGGCNDSSSLLPVATSHNSHQPTTQFMNLNQMQQPIYGTHQQQQQFMDQDDSSDSLDQYEIHQVDLDRDSKDSNWGIRLIGGSEVDRAISIGSIVFGGAASKNGLLKSGDEIISINGYNVVGATHQHVVDLISACANRASLVVKRKKFAEACEVVLTRNMDEGFGFVIISSHNCALIGSIIEGSPADRCRQLHVKDRIIAVNGNYITPDMQHPEIVNLIKECGSTLRLRIIPADCYTVKLIKSSQQDNFGFSMRGGSEYDGMPLYVIKVAPEGLACDLLNIGDQIIEINSIPTVGMTHQQAASLIKFSDPIVKLKLRRNYVIPPSLLVASPKELSKFNQVTAEMKTVNSTPNYLSSSSQDELLPPPVDHYSNQAPQLMPSDHLNQAPPPTNAASTGLVAATTETGGGGGGGSNNSNSMIYRQSMPLYAT